MSEAVIEVIVTRAGLTDRAEATSPENALYAARTLWDEAWARCPVQGATRAITTIFTVDGQHCRTVEGRRP